MSEKNLQLVTLTDARTAKEEVIYTQYRYITRQISMASLTSQVQSCKWHQLGGYPVSASP